MENEIIQKAKKAKIAARKLATLSTACKNEALLAMAQSLEMNKEKIMLANEKDLLLAKENGVSTAFYDRLKLTAQRIEGMAAGLRQVADLPDPIGNVMGMKKLPNELEVGQVKVPLGVIGMIYEARPNVTADAAGLCLKSGNAVILRGDPSAIHSNIAIASLLAQAGESVGIPQGAIQLVEDVSREGVLVMLKLNEWIDVVIPRGGAGLINTVIEHATVPVIQTGMGNCHAYVDAYADLEKALAIVFNGKTHRPGVCNALETVLVHKNVAVEFLPALYSVLQKAGVELRGCSRTLEILPDITPASEADWATEYLDMIIAAKIVSNIDEAIEHIETFSTKHSEVIITENYSLARRFLKEVDSAVVYVNASTRFSDGEQFGLGAEIGISTQKLHARGPMGMEQLTSTKFIVFGNGQIRK